MPNTKDLIPESSIIQAVLMGAPGSGKTWLCGTFPRPNFFDFDGKVGVVRNPDFVKRYGIRSIEYGQFSENKRIKGITFTHNAYDDACMYFDKWMAPALVGTFDTWVVDSGTHLDDASQNKALIVLGGSKRSTTQDRATKTGLVMMEQQDWGGKRSLTEQFIRMVRDSGKNLIVNVHQKETYGEGGILQSVQPLFTGQSTTVIPSMFKDCWYLKVQGAGVTSKRILIAEYDGITMARSELGIGTIEDPDYDKIIARIKSRAAEALTASTQSAVSQGTSVPAKLAG